MEIQDYKQYPHTILPETTHDEFARQEFVKSLKLHLATNVSPKNQVIYNQVVKPKFEKNHGRLPKDRHEVRQEMNQQPYYRLWSSMLRSSQEMMWSSCQIPVARQLKKLIAASKQDGAKLGSLKLNPDLEIPKYHSAVDIHCQPGAYHTEVCEDDVAAGAIYDSAVYVYAMGRMGPFNNDMGASQCEYIKAEYPDLQPKRILDLGCAVGHSTLPYVDAFPDAEIYAIDVAAPMLRYAHTRAESLGKKVHFSQQNAEKLDFEDGYFDLIVSHIFLHETSAKALRNSLSECYRLLSDGGLMVHSETPPYKDMDEYEAFILDWDTYNNNEPFWGYIHDLDIDDMVSEAGFNPSKNFEALVPSAYEAAEAKRTYLFQGGDFGGGGIWYLWGCRK